MKKIAIVLILVMVAISLAACSNNAAVEEAYLEGYDVMPFDKACREKGEEIVAAGKAVSYSVLWGEGWAGDAVPKEPELSGGEEMVMCEIRFTVNEGELEKKKRLKLYMIHDTKENLLTIKGGNNIDLMVTSIEADEAKEIVIDFLEEEY